MSTTYRFFLAVAALFCAGFMIGGYYAHRAGDAEHARAEHFATTAERLERGREVRVEGRLLEGAPATAPHSKKSCLAAATDISWVDAYEDANGKVQHDVHPLTTLRVGPPDLVVVVGDTQLRVPIERWSPEHAKSEEVDELPASLGVTEEQITAARRGARGTTRRFAIAESTLEGGAPVFVGGKLEDHDGALVVDKDPMLGRVVLVPGSRADYVAGLRGSSRGLRIAGWILGAVVGPLPLVLMAIVWLVRRGRAKA